MLQRASNNAYTYWWASSIRSKQSKWLDTDLEEMDVNVHSMMKLIELPDADSFGKRAELYFRRRPELISYLEDIHRYYKSLAVKYDKISAELHKANHTLASVCPDQLEYRMQDDDDFDDPTNPSEILLPPALPNQNLNNTNKDQPKKVHHRRISSQISKDKAQEELDRLQKEILGLQTEKEFIKSSYQGTLNRYLDIEKDIAEYQEEVQSLQDLYNTSAIIQDDEARALIAATALQSCEDSLVTIQELQKVSDEELSGGSEKIKDSALLLNVLKGEGDASEVPSAEKADDNTETDSTSVKEEEEEEEEEFKFLKREMELQAICDKIREHFQMSSEASILVLAEQFDELVEEVVNLEVSVSTHTAQIKRLNSETDELRERLKTLEEEKAALADNSDSLTEKLKQAEDESQRIQLLEKCIHDNKGVLGKQFIETCRNLTSLFDKLLSPNHQAEDSCEGCRGAEATEGILQVDLQELIDIPDFQKLLRYFGLQGKEKDFLTKYKDIVHNYRNTKNRLMEIEKKNKECHSEMMGQVKELKTVNAIKDDEARLLKEILTTLQASLLVIALEDMDKTSGEDENGEPHTPTLEEKFRADINRLLEENMGFWLRFSTSYHQIKKFQSTFKELKAEVERSDEVKSQEGNAHANTADNLGNQPLRYEKRIKELNTELQVWLEKNSLLFEELNSRYSSICSIKNDISRILNADEGEEVNLSHYQAAKFQGEALNMQLENNKIARELQAGMDFVKGLQVELSWMLAKINKNYELSARGNEEMALRHMPNKARIPLRTFLFGAKPSKKSSLFSCIGPVMDKEYSRLRHDARR